MLEQHTAQAWTVICYMNGSIDSYTTKGYAFIYHAE